jgi:hypothetical protein
VMNILYNHVAFHLTFRIEVEMQPDLISGKHQYITEIASRIIV